MRCDQEMWNWYWMDEWTFLPIKYAASSHLYKWITLDGQLVPPSVLDTVYAVHWIQKVWDPVVRTQEYEVPFKLVRDRYKELLPHGTLF